MANAAKKTTTPEPETSGETTKSVVTQGQTGMSVMEQQAAKVAGSQQVISSDILIPRLLLMQGISPLVTSRKAQIADIVRSTTGEKVADPDKGIDIIPLRMDNVWLKFETPKSAGTTKPAFRGQEPRTAANERLEWEYKGPEGQEMFRRKGIILFALLPADVEAYRKEAERAISLGEAPDLTKTVLPVVITFQSTSFKYAGRQCASFFNTVKVNQAKFPGIAPFQYLLPLTCKEEKKGDQAWYVYNLGVAKPLKDPELRAEAANWTMVLGGKGADVVVDDSGEVDEDDAIPTSGSRVTESEV